MLHDDITIEDVLEDETKNFLNIYDTNVTLNQNDRDNDDEISTVCDSNYYTPTEFRDMAISNQINNKENLTIVSINTANILTKLDHFKLLIKELSTQNNKIDLIAITETHLMEEKKKTFMDYELKNLLEGYKFICIGRKTKGGGGWVSCV